MRLLFAAAALCAVLDGCLVIDTIRQYEEPQTLAADEGDTGDTGATGDTSATGNTGDTSNTGSTGSTGFMAPSWWGTLGTTGHVGAFTTVDYVAGVSGGKGYAEDVGTLARFSDVSAVAVASDGTVYVADNWANTGERCMIRKVTPGGVTSLFAGDALGNCFEGSDGPAASANFNAIQDLLISPSDVMYVLTGTHVRKIDLAAGGAPVTTLTSALAYGSGFAFDDPSAPTALYITDTNANVVRKLDLNSNVLSAVTTLDAARPSSSTPRPAQCNSVTITNMGKLAVANNRLFITTYTGAIVSIDLAACNAGAPSGTSGVTTHVTGLNGPFPIIPYDATHVLVSDNTGQLFSVGATGLTGSVTTVLGSPYADSIDGTFLNGSTQDPNGLVLYNNRVYIVEGERGKVRVADLGTQMISTLAGRGYNNSGARFADGQGSGVRMWDPHGLTLHTDGLLYAVEADSVGLGDVAHVRTLNPQTGVSQTITLDGNVSGGAFDNLNGIAFDPRGRLWVTVGYEYSDFQHVVAAFDPNNSNTAGLTRVLLLGGDRPATGPTLIDGDAATARFDTPTDIAFDSRGNGYVADTVNNVIRKITFDQDGANPVVSTLQLGTIGYPYSLAITGNTLYFGTRSAIRKVDLTNPVSAPIIVGHATTQAFADGAGSTARLDWVTSIAVDASGNLWFADLHNQRLRYVTNPTGVPMVSTIVGTNERGVKIGALPSRTGAITAVRLVGGEPFFFTENTLLHLR